MDYNLRIAVVTETYPPEVNGVARTIATMVKGALERGDSIELIRPRQKCDFECRKQAIIADTTRPAISVSGSEALRLSEVLVPGLPVPGYAGIQFGLPVRGRLIERWRYNRPDVVQVVTEGPLGWAAISAARRLGIPVVSEYHTNFHDYSGHYGAGWFSNIISRYLRYLHNRSAVTLVPTAALAGELRAQGYRKVEVVSRGVNTTIFNAKHRSASLRASWGASDSSLVAAYVGRLAAEKNLDLVVRTFDAIRMQHPGARLVLVGDGPLRRVLAEHRPDCIFAGMRHGDDLGAHFASADMFIFPSLTETFGNVVSESLACGLPVVAYRRAAAAELVRDGVNGMLAAPGDEEAYIRVALALADSMRSAATREAVRQAAMASVATLSWAAIHQRMNDVLVRSVARMPVLECDAQGRALPSPT